MNDQAPAARDQAGNARQSHDNERSPRESKEATIAGFSRHMVAIVSGLLLTILGIGLSVTIVLLPIGVPMAVFGGLTLVWGIYERSIY